MAQPQPPTIQIEASLEAVHEASFGWAKACCQGDADAAADVLQTAYAKVLSGAARFEGRSTFKTWFFGVIRLTTLERWREGAREQALGEAGMLEQQTSDPADVALMEAEEGESIRRALAQLPARQEQVLHLVFYQEMSIAEAADVMEVSLGSARTHYERGKKRLRTLLSPAADERIPEATQPSRRFPDANARRENEP
jgi:RNA polymerase sigma-70 factor (ECF subfamily)